MIKLGKIKKTKDIYNRDCVEFNNGTGKVQTKQGIGMIQFQSIGICNNCNGDCVTTKSYTNMNVCPDTYSCGSTNSKGEVMFTSEYGWYFDDMNCYMIDYKNLDTSCTKCKCDEIKDSNITVKDIVDASRIIKQGIDTYNCLGFCNTAKLDYNNDGYVDIEDIVSMIDCIENNNCKRNYICGVNT